MYKANNTLRILAQDQFLSNDTRTTGINNNDLIIGPTGAGKTRSYVKPNIMQCNESMIVADTKGNLFHEVGPLLEENGYRVLLIDLKTMNSNCRYNPLDYIGYDPVNNRYSEKDIKKAAKAMTPIDGCADEPFWDEAARQYLVLFIAYVLQYLPKEEHTMEYVVRLFRKINSPTFTTMLDEACRMDPDGLAARIYSEIHNSFKADKMTGSIIGILSTYIFPLTLDSAMAMYKHPNRFRFRDLGKEKTALFLNVSDTDRSMDVLVDLLYTQALQDLCDFADLECEGQRLSVPVRFYLDDFATNAFIPDFDKIISVIRSREIYVSIILQSISQLEGLYGKSKANTIIDNCDTLLYLGGQNMETAQYIGQKMDLPLTKILQMPIDDAYLFTRGQEPKKVQKFDIRTHSNYDRLPEAHSEEAEPASLKEGTEQEAEPASLKKGTEPDL